MTFEEFEKACKLDIRKEIELAGNVTPRSAAIIRGRINGMIFAARQFLPIRYNEEVNALARQLKVLVQVAEADSGGNSEQYQDGNWNPPIRYQPGKGIGIQETTPDFGDDKG